MCPEDINFLKTNSKSRQLYFQMFKFFQLMGSRKFRTMRSISFRPLGFSSVFMSGEWMVFHEPALKTYYNIMFNLRFEELPISTDPTTTHETRLRECEPFVIELPGMWAFWIFVVSSGLLYRPSGVQRLI